ncbi:hypothetical protein THRCLA_01280 [Thraustotheca clavata]|uniref:Uncharacterized protein n=1 Tax=Thraustotheca clavata TaxID=74557 RepID=A0A1W0A8S7_9STRA|nr:hypothetical protein THRCLA_01280 [Thraustotheca clavata]
MLSSSLSSLAASLASTANVVQLHTMLHHSVHFPKKVSQLWQHFHELHSSNVVILTKAPLDLDAALINAVTKNSIDILRLVLDYGASVHTKIQDQRTILHSAVALGYAPIASELITRGAIPSLDMLDEAISHQHVEMVKLLLQHIEIDGAVLHHAIASNASPTIVQAVLTAIHDDNVVDELRDNMTPLMLAASKGFARLCDILLDQNADVYAENEDGNTALHFACANGHIYATYSLLQAGADMDMPNLNDESPLDVAAAHLKPLLDCNGVIDESIVLKWQEQLATRGSLLPAPLMKKRAIKYADYNLPSIAED